MVGTQTRETSDEGLAQRARSDSDAFVELYLRYYHRIRAFAYRRTGDAQAAEDIASATFEQAMRHLERFDGRAQGFRPWIFQIAANQIADHHRGLTRARNPRAVAAAHTWHAETGDTPFERVEDQVDSGASGVLDALSDLSPRYQQALSLRYLAGLPLREVASAMGCSTPTVSVVLHRAVSALRRAMINREEMRDETQ